MVDASASSSGPRASPPSLKVFLVENHEDTRTLLCLLIETLGHRVRTAQTMREALEALKGANFDVLISDIGLPDGDGWELMRRLQPSRPIFAVAISGFGMSSDCARSRAVGYRHHLVKPYGIEQLPGILREAARERGRPAVQHRAVAEH
jgi:two-component system CheB/CheR fusion protein